MLPTVSQVRVEKQLGTRDKVLGESDVGEGEEEATDLTLSQSYIAAG